MNGGYGELARLQLPSTEALSCMNEWIYHEHARWAWEAMPRADMVCTHCKRLLEALGQIAVGGLFPKDEIFWWFKIFSRVEEFKHQQGAAGWAGDLCSATELTRARYWPKLKGDDPPSSAVEGVDGLGVWHGSSQLCPSLFLTPTPIPHLPGRRVFSGGLERPLSWLKSYPPRV